MSVFRVKKNKNYTVMANYHLKDVNLSLDAKGLLSLMLSLPEDWDYSMKGLCAKTKEGIKAIRRTLHELEQTGYLKRTRTSDQKGYFDYIYDIYEQPQPVTPEPYALPGHTVEGHTLAGHALKGTLLNTNILNTKELNTNKQNTHMSQPAEPAATCAPEEAIKLAKKLKERILDNKPNRKIDRGWEENWSRDIEKLHRIDGRSWEDIEKVIDWSQDSAFWRTNILSGKKLRDKIDILEDQMARDNNSTSGGGVFDASKIGV